jgi:hypothetical protein
MNAALYAHLVELFPDLGRGRLLTQTPSLALRLLSAA